MKIRLPIISRWRLQRAKRLREIRQLRRWLLKSGLPALTVIPESLAGRKYVDAGWLVKELEKRYDAAQYHPS